MKIRSLLSLFFILQSVLLSALPYAYAPNSITHEVTVMDSATNTIVTTIPVPDSPGSVAATPDGKYVYIGLIDGTIAVISTATNAVIDTIYGVPAPSPDYVHLSISPDSAKAYAAINTSTVYVLDLINNTVSGTISLSQNTFFAVISPNGMQAYASFTGGTIQPIDAVNDTVLGTAFPTTHSNPSRILYSADGASAYIICGAHIDFIDTLTNTDVGSVTLANNAMDIVISPDGATLYADIFHANTMTVIDTATKSITQIVPNLTPGGSPGSMTISPDGRKIYVLDQSTNAAVVDFSTSTFGIASFTSPLLANIVSAPVPLPILASISSASGPTTGGTVVTLTGSGFTSAISVNFGSAPATGFTIHSDTSITAIAPPGVRTANVTITNLGGTNESTLLGLFTYISPTPPSPPSPTPVILPASPTNFKSKWVKNEYITKSKKSLRLTWSPAADPTVTGYLLYKNKKLLAEFSASGPFLYIENHVKKGTIYALVSMNAQGAKSPPVTVTVD